MEETHKSAVGEYCEAHDANTTGETVPEREAPNFRQNVSEVFYCAASEGTKQVCNLPAQ